MPLAWPGASFGLLQVLGFSLLQHKSYYVAIVYISVTLITLKTLKAEIQLVNLQIWAKCLLRKLGILNAGDIAVNKTKALFLRSLHFSKRKQS